jgi:hypothetical protein
MITQLGQAVYQKLSRTPLQSLLLIFSGKLLMRLAKKLSLIFKKGINIKQICLYSTPENKNGD